MVDMDHGNVPLCEVDAAGKCGKLKFLGERLKRPGELSTAARVRELLRSRSGIGSRRTAVAIPVLRVHRQCHYFDNIQDFAHMLEKPA